jgi:hypothetical protein
MKGARIRRTPRQLQWGVAVWSSLVGVILLWQAVTYRGLIAFGAEWQLNEFGNYYPILTYMALLVLFVAPSLLLLRSKNSRSQPLGSIVELRRAEAFARRSSHVVFAVAAICLCASAISLVLMALLPGASGAPQRISVNDTTAAQPREGLTELSGKILYNRTSAFEQDLWVAHRSTRFAPIVEEGADESAIRYFVELSPTDRLVPNGGPTGRQGILKEGALPGELARLYRYAGFRIAPSHYVLFASAATMRWPYQVATVEFLIAGLLASIVGAVVLFRRRHLTTLLKARSA